jgi:hypothetical protein
MNKKESRVKIQVVLSEKMYKTLCQESEKEFCKNPVIIRKALAEYFYNINHKEQ